MVKISIVYQGEKHCELTHGPSGSKIMTDAPKDNNGRGEAFSPTDLVAAALGSCILTVMAIVAERDGVSMTGARAEVVKEMNPQPRFIGRLQVQIHLPASIPEDYRPKLERTAHTCPVHKSLGAETQIQLEFQYQ